MRWQTADDRAKRYAVDMKKMSNPREYLKTEEVLVSECYCRTVYRGPRKVRIGSNEASCAGKDPRLLRPPALGARHSVGVSYIQRAVSACKSILQYSVSLPWIV